MLLLILLTYVLSVTIMGGRAISIVVAVQIATIWVVLRASEARRGLRVFVSALAAISAIVAIANVFIPDRVDDNGFMALVNALLYLGAPFTIVRHLVLRRTVDRETVLGAIAAYLMMGMFFAFVYRALGRSSGSVLRGLGRRDVSAGPVLLVHDAHHDRLRQPHPRRKPRTILRRPGDAHRAAVPGDGSGESSQRLAAAASQEHRRA